MIILDVEGKCKGFFEKNRKKLKGGSRSGIISNIWASILSKNGGYRVSMIKIKDYVRVGSLEEAYELNQKRSACILGGMLWTKMGQRQVQTAIDLSGLGLDQIEESEEEFSIGCVVTLRQMEEHEGLNAYTDGAARESVRSIVGVQFRNLATVGGSIFGRFGFSDVLTLFLALDTEVELVHAGRMPLAEFACSKRDRDVLVRLIVKKHEGVTVYQSHRNSRTDFPVLTCAVRVEDGKGCAVLGARPAKAARVELPAELAEKLAEIVPTLI